MHQVVTVTFKSYLIFDITSTRFVNFCKSLTSNKYEISETHKVYLYCKFNYEEADSDNRV